MHSRRRTTQKILESIYVCQMYAPPDRACMRASIMPIILGLFRSARTLRVEMRGVTDSAPVDITVEFHAHPTLRYFNLYCCFWTIKAHRSSGISRIRKKHIRRQISKNLRPEPIVIAPTETRQVARVENIY